MLKMYRLNDRDFMQNVLSYSLNFSTIADVLTRNGIEVSKVTINRVVERLDLNRIQEEITTIVSESIEQSIMEVSE